MTEIEAHAHELVRRKEWVRAVELYDQLLGAGINKQISKERVVACLLGRSECCLELGRHEAVVADCRRIIKLLADGNENNTGARARRRLVHALFSLRRFSEAEMATREWLALNGGVQNNPEALKMLENLRSVLQMTNSQKGGTSKPQLQQQQLEEELVCLERRFEAWPGPGHDKLHGDASVVAAPIISVNASLNASLNALSGALNAPLSCPLSAPLNVASVMVQDGVVVPEGHAVCTYCSLSFRDRLELRAHCQTESHQTMIMSDEGRDWRWRPPPRGFTADVYSACESWSETGVCRYGAQCVEAHGLDELTEWKERFEYRRMKLQRASEKELYGKSYTEQLLERWLQAPSPERVMREKLEAVQDSCSGDLVTTMSSKHSKRDWTFTLVSRRRLSAVALLQDAHRNHFALKQVIPGNIAATVSLSNDQEWLISGAPDVAVNPEDEMFEHKITVSFHTDIYGTFRQSVVFDFGAEPVLVKHLCVDVLPVTDADRIKEIKKEIVVSSAERWDNQNADIVPFSSPVPPLLATPAAAAAAKDGEWERELLAAYPCPRADTFTLTHSTVAEKRLTRNNYRARMHELLCVEEMARYEQVARYNLTAKLHVTYSYLLAPNGIATSTAKYSHSGELFALMTLGKDISEDTSAGRLILNNCTTVFIAAENSTGGTTSSSQAEAPNPTQIVQKLQKPKRKVYEALIEDKGKNMIYLRLPAACVADLNLKSDTDFFAEVQFQLNRIPYCEWHYAIDKIADFGIIFPDTYLEPNIPWTPQRQWADILDVRLNLKQKEAVVAITTPTNVPLPPILIIGPFGTGKTYTLAQAIKQLLLQPNTRILICTHSNSAADLYIKDYLHPYVEAGHEEARPLRVYYHKRWVATVNQIVQKYCLIEMNGGVRSFRVPTLDDILQHRIVVVTLSISMYLSNMGLPKGHFTHILLDEAAQAMECEAIMPLALADRNTRIVLAGDHMQLSPELFSQFAKERRLHVSLLERLYDHYPSTFPCKILLCENYRAHEAIIRFTSELFYDQKLISSGKQPRHDKFYPLTFFTTRGEDVQDQNSTAFYNNSEVYEVVERVCELKKKWPAAWGKMDDQSIGIMTPYADQVFRIRSELRKRRMGGISVERVLNVQGKQFRAIFLSTVRTRRTCTGSKAGDEVDYGFLSNSKLLNTAITRAQSLVAVVGDPVALCSIGRCRKVWERFLEICNENKSLFGITWSLLRSQLDGVELKKTYVLNPLAPEFVPRHFLTETYIKMPALSSAPAQAPPLSFGPLAGARFPQQQPPPPQGLPQYSAPPPVYPVPPMYFISTGQPHFLPSNQPPPPQMFPMRPPGPPGPPGPPPPFVNPWSINYPLPSPSNDAASSTSAGSGNGSCSSINGGWPPKITPLPPKKPLETVVAERMHGLPAAQRSPSSGGEVALPPQFMSLQGPKLPDSAPMTAPRISDKDQIQFLHNVHFPERQHIEPPQPPPHVPVQMSVALPVQVSVPLQVSENRLFSTDWAGLLPPNVSPADMLLAPQAQQLQWCRYLHERYGSDAANKFRELLLRAKRSQHADFIPLPADPPHLPAPLPLPAVPLPPTHTTRTMEDDVSPLLDNLLQNGQHGMLPPAHHSLFADNAKVLERFNFNKPMYLRDMDTSILLANLQNAQVHMRDEAYNVPWPNAQAQSVPLYRRQGPQPQQAQLQQQQQLPLPPQPQPQLLQQQQLMQQQQQDSAHPVDKPGVSSSAFSGYARAAVSIRELQQQQLQQQQQQQPQVQGLTQQQLNQLQQQHWQRQINAEFAAMKSCDSETIEEMLTRHHAATYASVLRANNKHLEEEQDKIGDPFAVLRDLGQRAGNQTAPGLYQYFS